jgi:hypothetical protein
MFAIFMSLLVIAASFVSLWLLWPKAMLRPCSSLPTIDRSESVWAQHADARSTLERMQPERSVKLELDINRCPGRAEVLVYYGSERQRKKIQKSIGATYFGIPYRLINW